MAPKNVASYFKEPKGVATLDDAEYYTPGPGELLVKILSIGFNPVEAKLQRFAMFPIPYPAIPGVSFAGTVEAIGNPGSSRFKVGDRVTVNRTGGKNGDPRFGAYQRYALAIESGTALIPDSITFEQASITVTSFATAVSALFVCLRLDRPPIGPKAAPNGKKVLIYGGSSSVGGLAVKLAVSAGYDVVTTSSPRNWEFVAQYGAKHMIDHAVPEDELIAQLKAHGPYDAVFDSIGTWRVTNLFGKWMSPEGGTYWATLPPTPVEDPLPANISRLFASYPWAFEKPENVKIGKWLFEEYLPWGLRTGEVIPPRPEVIQGGLEGVQVVLDRMMPPEEGVSGRKFVMNPQL